MNLIKNALKFTTRGQIEVKVNYKDPLIGENKSTLQVDVKDSGVGIAEEDIGKLFTRFGKL